MKIIDTFLISEEFEADLLYIKLINETEGVHTWIGIESNTTFRGESKPFCLENILKQDRFFPFKDRIYVISNTEPILDPSLPAVEKSFFTAEFKSRSLCFDYLKENFSNDDYIILSDVDESLDFSRPDRRDLLFKIFNENNAGIEIANLKYWYQPNCLNFDPAKRIPAKPLGMFKENPGFFAHRNNHSKTINTDLILGFEYAYNFSLTNNFRKCSTFAHDRYTIKCIEQGLNGCHWHKCPERGERLGDQIWDWFELIELNENNSPNIVLENFDKFNPNTVNPNYSEVRRRQYGMQYPHPVEQHGLLRGNKIDRRYHYLRRGK